MDAARLTRSAFAKNLKSNNKETKMKSKMFKVGAALALLAVSAAAAASSMDCCLSVECCLRMLGCC